MKFRTTIKLVFIVPILTSLSACYELQSDEELRQDIIGTWGRKDCQYPYCNDPDEATGTSPIHGKMTFYADGRYVEGFNAYCVEDSCGSYGYCTCSWEIQEGKLLIHTTGNTAGYGRLNIAYPIVCLKKDKLVFDNVMFNGQLVKKACFRRL